MDATKTTMLSIQLAKYLRGKYGTLMKQIIEIIETRNPQSFDDIDALFPSIGQALDAINPDIKRTMDGYLRQAYGKGKIHGQESVSKVLKEEVKIPFTQPHKNAMAQVSKFAFTN